MNVALIGAELEENLALRYIASSLEACGHNVDIVPFNSEQDAESAVRQTLAFEPRIVGLSMVFTARGAASSAASLSASAKQDFVGM